MFMLVSWFGLTLPLLNAADWFRLIRLLKRLFVSSHLSEVIYVWCYCWRYCFCSCWWRSEERRVGKECRSRWAADHCKKKQRRMGMKKGVSGEDGLLGDSGRYGQRRRVEGSDVTER